MLCWTPVGLLNRALNKHLLLAVLLCSVCTDRQAGLLVAAAAAASKHLGARYS